MNADMVTDLSREAMLTAVIIGAPILLVGAAIGFVIGLFQAMTQIQDQTVSFVPKIVAMLAVIGLCLPWLIQRMLEYSHDLIANIPRMIVGG